MSSISLCLATAIVTPRISSRAGCDKSSTETFHAPSSLIPKALKWFATANQHLLNLPSSNSHNFNFTIPLRTILQDLPHHSRFLHLRLLDCRYTSDSHFFWLPLLYGIDILGFFATGVDWTSGSVPKPLNVLVLLTLGVRVFAGLLVSN